MLSALLLANMLSFLLAILFSGASCTLTYSIELEWYNEWQLPFAKTCQIKEATEMYAAFP